MMDSLGQALLQTQPGAGLMAACPVCTLYLREGMSMHSHLDTHPKDQVIEALVRMYATPPPLQPSPQSPNHSPYHSGPSPQTSIVSSFLPMSLPQPEDHHATSTYKIQQVMHQPVVPYPVYSQHQTTAFLQTTGHHYIGAPGLLDDPTAAHSNQPLESTPNTATVVDLSQVQNGRDNSFKPEVVLVTEAGGLGAHQQEEDDSIPGSPRSALSIRTDLTAHHSHGASGGEMPSAQVDHHSRDTYILSDCCNYQDEAARHAPHPHHHQLDSTIKSHADDVMMESDRRLDVVTQCLETEERMPPQGEITEPSPTPEWVQRVDSVPVVTTDNVWDLRSEDTDKKMDERARYPCLYCEESLDTPTERRVHIATVHCGGTVEAPSIKQDLHARVPNKTCLKCDRSFPSLKAMSEHNKTEHPRLVRCCDVCRQTFPDRLSFAQHLSTVHPLECKQCGKTFTRPASLNLHAKTHLEVKPHACHLCPKTFVTPQKLKEHINGHTGAAPLSCNLCPRTFKRYSNLKQHKDLTHFKLKKKKKDFFCHCGESFLSKKKLAKHEETHDTKPKQCPYCVEKFIYVTSLTRHIRHNHDAEYLPLPPAKGSKQRNVRCPVCDQTLLESSLPTHLKFHSEAKKFSCPICGKKFHKKWNLHLHKWTHASRISKPYKCNLCKGAFIRFGDFQAHLRSHLGHKPFTCNHCGMQFIRKQNWHRHEKEHSGIKTYACNECGKTFFRSYYLSEHLKVHSGQRPFTCHICNKASTTKSNHNKHLRTHHAREVLNTEG